MSALDLLAWSEPYDPGGLIFFIAHSYIKKTNPSVSSCPLSSSCFLWSFVLFFLGPDGHPARLEGPGFRCFVQIFSLVWHFQWFHQSPAECLLSLLGPLLHPTWTKWALIAASWVQPHINREGFFSLSRACLGEKTGHELQDQSTWSFLGISPEKASQGQCQGRAWVPVYPSSRSVCPAYTVLAGMSAVDVGREELTSPKTLLILNLCSVPLSLSLCQVVV